MELPYSLRNAIEELAGENDRSRLVNAARTTSERYRDNSGSGGRLLTTDTEAAAYAAARMPATYGAVRSALAWTLSRMGNMGPVSLLDVGAGTGAGTWAAMDEMETTEMRCLEREKAMRTTGERLMQLSGDEAARNVRWQEFDLTGTSALPGADVVLVSYVLNELSNADRINAAKRLFAAADRLLLIVEPGTPQAWKQLMEIRSALIADGAEIAAPCTHMDDCPVTGDDWCHFTCRVARTRLHKALKTGDAPYEDEKFTYLALTKAPAVRAKGRVLRHPQIEPGRITLKICTGSGLESLAVRKKDGGLFKWARKCACGDELPDDER